MNDLNQETQAAGQADEIFDLLVVGAGPTGLACAIEAQKAGFRAVVVDKGCLCNSLFHYPSHMTFFTCLLYTSRKAIAAHAERRSVCTKSSPL